ncbi:MAG: hypothetical protein GX680_05470 [Bacteroidales bacterium]|uniref:hypothetical protein n=1 Tax=Bacteroides graminisolvens TaxID=477666 RepID=UPI00168F1C4D|nr:hypothetical protein [Bacteroides graminisolvens]NLC86378.1 hypothetical protein [Bacteroidales bacterium]
MKIIYKYLLFTFLLFNFSCNDSDAPININEKYRIVVESFIKDKSNVIIPDYNADVFIYWGIYSLEIVDFELREDGTMISDSKVIKPSLISNINSIGECTFEFEQIDEKITIIIRSKIKQGGVAISSFTNSRYEINFINVFQ